MIDSQHYQWLRGLWLGVFLTFGLTLIVLALVDWPSYASITTWLAVTLIMHRPACGRSYSPSA
jgi:hypothetical protein